MKLTKKIWGFVVAMAGVIASSGMVSAYETLPAKMDGTMMPYDFRHGDSIVPWAYTDMEPIAVSYVARHGARYLSSEKKVETLLKAVRKAREAGTMTPDGEAFASLLDTVCEISRGKWGDLSPLGEAEEQRLGEQLCEQIGNLSERIVGNAESSCVPRVVRTMWDFLYPVAAKSENNSITTSEGPQFSPLVRFFETDPVYSAYIKEGDWTEVYDRYYKETVSPDPARRLFGAIGSEEHLRKLTMDLYGVLQSFRCTGLPAPTTRWMSASEYRACWEASNLKRYLTRSLTSLSNEAMVAVSPLLKAIVGKTDEAIASVGKGETGEVNANFWFGHAETLLPLTALMGLPGCVTMPLDWSELTDVWRDYNITPMAANILIVLLRDPKTSEIHASVRLNGLWVAPVGGEGLTPTWESVRAHWLRRIDQIGSGAVR